MKILNLGSLNTRNSAYNCRTWVERLTASHIYRILPRGINFAVDIQSTFPGYKIKTIFDVGANVGQSAKKFLVQFPGSHIYCFEPVTDTFRLLSNNYLSET